MNRQSKILRALTGAFLVFNAIAIIIESGLLAHEMNGRDDKVRGFYRVFNLLPGDTLNVREEPSAESKILDQYEQGKVVFATGKSETNDKTKWISVGYYGERLGWVSTRFLQPQKILNLPGTQVPRSGICHGFEPMLDLKWDQREISVNGVGKHNGQGTLKQILSPVGFSMPNILIYTNPARNVSYRLLLLDMACIALPVGDSHQSGLLMVEHQGSLTVYNGCCNPSANSIVPAN